MYAPTEFMINGQKVPAVKVMQATVLFNVTGLPALSIPFGKSREGLPVAVQLVGPWFGESTILRLAAQLEAASPVRGLHPDI